MENWYTAYLETDESEQNVSELARICNLSTKQAKDWVYKETESTYQYIKHGGIADF